MKKESEKKDYFENESLVLIISDVQDSNNFMPVGGSRLCRYSNSRLIKMREHFVALNTVPLNDQILNNLLGIMSGLEMLDGFNTCPVTILTTNEDIIKIVDLSRQQHEIPPIMGFILNSLMNITVRHEIMWKIKLVENINSRDKHDNILYCLQKLHFRDNEYKTLWKSTSESLFENTRSLNFHMNEINNKIRYFKNNTPNLNIPELDILDVSESGVITPDIQKYINLTWTWRAK